MARQTQIFEKAALSAISKALANQTLDSPEVVAEAVAKTLTTSHPKTRYLVGKGSKMVGLLKRLPDRK